MPDYGAASTVTLAAATAAQVLQARQGRRIAFSIANVGSNAVYINMSDKETATSSYGVYLAPGGILSDSNAGGYFCWQGNISAISAYGSTLSVWERSVQ